MTFTASNQGVREYWIFERKKETVEIYHQENAVLKLAVTLFKEDNLTSPFLSEFSCAGKIYFNEKLN